MDPGVISSLLSHPLPDGLLLLDRDGRCLLANAAAQGRGLDALVERHAPSLAGLRARLSQGEEAVDCELPGADGALQACMRVVSRDQQGVVAYSLSVQLSSVAGAWLEAAESGGHGLWVWDIRQDRLQRSVSWLRLMGHEGASAAVGSFADAQRRAHPDDRGRLRAALEAHLAGRSPAYLCEYRCLHRDGSWRWVRDAGRVTAWDASGTPLRMAGTVTGIGSQKQLEQRLREQRGLVEETQRLAGMASWTWDASTDVVWCTRELRTALGLDDGLRVRAWLRRCRGDRQALRQGWNRLRQGDGTTSFELTVEAAAGRLHLQVWASPRCDGERLLRVIAQIQDLTAQRRADAANRRRGELLRRVAELGRIGGCEIDAATRTLHWTEECARLHGREGSTMALDELLRHYTIESRDALHEAMARVADGADAISLDLCFYRPDGVQVWVQAVVEFDRDGATRGRHLVLFRDISREREASARIELLSHYDTLTRLPNRTRLREEIEAVLAAADCATGHALLLLDLDGFGGINEAHGHAAGDTVLKTVAARLHMLVDAGDLFGRLGGDEFVVLLRQGEGREAIAATAQRIVTGLSDPVPVDGEILRFGVSAGIAIRPADVGFDELLRAAAAALHNAKQDDGRNRIQFHSPEAWRRSRRRLDLEQAMRGALEREEFSLVYQPLYELRSSTVVGVEALLRWHHRDLGNCPPDEFIPIAEATGDIAAIGDWVLREACRQAAAWARAGITLGRMSVNVSAVQLRDPGFAARVLGACAESGWPPTQLELELTESALLRDTPALWHCFEVFAREGVALAIDDFGIGFSSLSYLSRFPVGRLKIDRSFIAGLGEGRRSAEVTRAIIQLGKALRMQVLAEGVETADDERLLREFGCDEVQGFLYARPLPAHEVARWLQPRPGDAMAESARVTVLRR
ncbi:bifunctional diguanylate cyclase/phosphodiesterase [Luteimonas sp. MHLX1A]|uniref:bifunctional diguanylate cyclase/phosphodiesterase n=1 Tax=Alterluteimonas muca TaxID=2878684 RepID=UPI001E2C1EEE|nr:GGDEF domain-containing phosphodiesterase [Luteimonas sp. MHLX1A]MCD9045759.1 EAL domain-containing protein [Luteimonas sp. MHLX1A]